MRQLLALLRIKRPTPPTRKSLLVSAAAIGLLAAWLFHGGSIIAGLNPKLSHELAQDGRPALDVWISPPDYAKAPPTIISTPAGTRYEDQTLVVLQGSTISAHLADQDGEPPQLIVDGKSHDFTADDHGDFAAFETLDNGKKLVIRRGWKTLASWKLRVLPDAPPVVTLTETPSLADSHHLRLSYKVSDNFGITDISLRVTPRDPSPGANNAPIDIPLPVAGAKDVTRTDTQDLSMHPWAGQTVDLQIVATNEAGKKSASDKVPFAIPDRHFFHPIARVLLEERKKLMRNPDSTALMDEAANIMAGIAHETTNYHGDPVILMALRTGAVRLVLGHNRAATLPVNDLLWQTATRIEDGRVSTTRRALRDVRQDLSENY